MFFIFIKPIIHCKENIIIIIKILNQFLFNIFSSILV